ncbi:MAG TPA: AbrB/MazE/SpoVT family DNA-binding domain-containing protein [Phenylobacterium sp.]|nr:AbrB/MazE/SpoVT family DNA-binding domain-containing protein [Phenylobacterium sp.]
MTKIVASDMTVSDKIRALSAAGYQRAEIARLLGKRYQHVRNVLEADKLHPPRAARSAAAVAEPARAFDHGQRSDERSPVAGAAARYEPEVESRGGGVFRLVVREDGSVVLPAEARELFGIRGRGVVMAELAGDEFRLISTMTALKRAQDMLRPYMKEGVSWADELIAERRREAEREASDD